MYVVDTACSHVLWPSSHEHTRALSSSNNTQSSTRATLDPSSTRMPVVAVLGLLRTARAAHERRSMMSRFPSLLHCNKKDTGPRSLDCSSATSTRQTRARRGQAVAGTRALSSSSSSSSSTQAAREQHSTQVALVRLLLLLFYCCVYCSTMSLSSTVCCCCSCSKKRGKQNLRS